jgi:hypothetical protein
MYYIILGLKQHKKRVHSLIAVVPMVTAQPPVDEIEEEQVADILAAQETTVPAAPIPGLPTKVEWTMPEDDIPSMEEVQEVLASEQIADMPTSPIEAELEASPLVTPTKIEWAMPEDDIPSLEDVQEVLASQEIVEAPAAQSKLEPPQFTSPSAPSEEDRMGDAR